MHELQLADHSKLTLRFFDIYGASSSFARTNPGSPQFVVCPIPIESKQQVMRPTNLCKLIQLVAPYVLALAFVDDLANITVFNIDMEPPPTVQYNIDIAAEIMSSLNQSDGSINTFKRARDDEISNAGKLARTCDENDTSPSMQHISRTYDDDEFAGEL
eukprot:TRINITY_DN18459_c0_g1::TRINITY_DN18459_c0_g1_i1::g.2865::m.2865 TRINITY_DN18459_c0_g1::TRINITY_DN18459_c0_g1_i1::g.2865  ORF type:complete len:159 (-),score=14.54 TRINITY_DN18459_c0_g1_i1:345-821(-)